MRCTRTVSGAARAPSMRRAPSTAATGTPSAHAPSRRRAVLQSMFNHLMEAHNRRDVEAIVITGAGGAPPPPRLAAAAP